MTPKLRDRRHLDLVLLAGLQDRPCSGAELAREVARRSGGRLVLGTQTVYNALHHMLRNDLVASHGAGRYRLTDAGERSLRHREREWEAYVAGVDGVRSRRQEGDVAAR